MARGPARQVPVPLPIPVLWELCGSWDPHHPQAFSPKVPFTWSVVLAPPAPVLANFYENV